MTRSNTMTYTSRRSNHAESSTTGARRARQEVSDRDQTDEEDGTGNADGDDAEFHSRPTQQAGQTSTLGGGESHQSKAAARKKSEMGAAVSHTPDGRERDVQANESPAIFQAYRRLVTDTIKMVLYATQRRQAIKKEDINKKGEIGMLVVALKRSLIQLLSIDRTSKCCRRTPQFGRLFSRTRRSN